MLDDAKMGWARYAHSMRVFCLNSGLFYIRPTLASSDLLKRIAHRLDTENGWDQAIFNEVILLFCCVSKGVVVWLVCGSLSVACSLLEHCCELSG